MADTVTAISTVITMRPPYLSVQMPSGTRISEPVSTGVAVNRPNSVALRPSVFFRPPHCDPARWLDWRQMGHGEKGQAQDRARRLKRRRPTLPPPQGAHRQQSVARVRCHMHPTAPAPQPVRSQLPAVPGTLLTRWSGTAALSLLLGLWLATAALSLHSTPGLLQIGCGLALGILAALLVVVGHDAEHGSLSPWPRWNAVASRLAFLPAWQPASGWTHEHQRHHAWTNLKQRDEGYPPPSPADWCGMPRWQRLWWRCALTLPGVGLLYLDVWWRCVIWVCQPPPGRRRVLRADSLLVLAFICAQATLAWRFAGGASAVWWLVALPFVVMNTLVSAITVMHHRHPMVVWYDELAAWSRPHSQVAGAVHLVLPTAWQWGLLNIFEHGAHHADLRRPFVALPAAQQALEQLHGPAVVVQHEEAPWRLRHLRRVLRECQLYDYRAQRWLRFVDA